MKTQYTELKKVENQIKSIVDMEQRAKRLIIFLKGIPKGKNNKNEGDRVYKGIMAKMFSRMIKDGNPHSDSGRTE